MTELRFQALHKVQLCAQEHIGEVIAGLESALEFNTDAAGQKQHIESCIERLQPSAAVLKLLQFSEASILLEETGILLRRGIKLEEKEKQDVLQLLYTTLIDLPALLDKQFSKDDYPVYDYLILINRLRKLRGASVIFSLVPIQNSSQINFRLLQKRQAASFKKLLTKQLSLYREALENLREQSDLLTGLDSLYRILSNLEMMNRDYRLGTLWGLSLAVVESLDRKSLQTDSTALVLLSSFEALLERIIQDARTLEQNIDETILEKLFDELTKAEVTSERIRAVKYWYNLDITLCGDFRRHYNRLQAKYARQEAGINAGRLLLESVRLLSDSVNQFIKDDNCEESGFRDIIAQLEVQANTATSLTLRPAKDMFDAAITLCLKRLGDLDGKSRGSSDPDFFTAVLERCVQYLYRSELWLRSYIKGNMHGQKTGESFNRLDMFSDARLKLVEEVQKELELIFIGLNDYVDAGCKPAHLSATLEKLDAVSNTLSLLPATEAAMLTSGVKHYFELVENSQTLPDASMGSDFFTLAEALVLLSDYLEKFRTGDADEQCLLAEQERLNQLEAYFLSNFTAKVLRFPNETDEAETVGKETDPDRHESRLVEKISDEVQIHSGSDYSGDTQIRATFIEESVEIISALSDALEQMKTAAADHETLEALCRGFHTLKGSGRMVGAEPIVTLASGFEDILNNLLSSGEMPGIRQLTAIEESLEKLPILIEDFRQGRESSIDIQTLLIACQLKSPENSKADSSVEQFMQDEPESGMLPVKTGSPVKLEKTTGINPTVSGFIQEAEKQLVTIQGLLQQGTAATAGQPQVVANDFIIAVHTLAGSSRVAGLEDYADMLGPLEKVLQTHPARELTANLFSVLEHLLECTQAYMQSLQQKQQTLTEALPEQQKKFQRALLALSLENSGTDSLQDSEAGKTDTHNSSNADEKDLQLQGFLREARQIETSIRKIQQKLPGSGADYAQCCAELIRQLELFQSAARVAEQYSLKELCHSLAEAYNSLKNHPDNLSTSENILAAAHRYLHESLEALEKNKALALPEDLLDRLEGIQFQEETAAGQESSGLQAEVVDEALLMTFLEEAEELLQELESNISAWQQNSSAREQLDEILRALHTLKGSAALVGEKEMSEQAHSFESFVIQADKNDQPLDQAFFTELETRTNVLQLLFALYHRNDQGELIRDHMQEAGLSHLVDQQNRQVPSEEDAVEMRHENSKTEQSGVIKAAGEETLIRSDKNPGGAETKPEASMLVSKPALPAQELQSADHDKSTAGHPVTLQDENIRVSGNLMKSLLNDAYEINVSHHRMESSIAELVSQLHEIEATMTRLQKYMRTIEAQADTVEQQIDKVQHSKQNDFDALEMESFSELQQISLSLREDYEDLNEIKTSLSNKIRDVDEILNEQQNSTNNLQQGLISSQMLPFASLFPRLRRLTHQLGQTLGKDVAIAFSNTEDRLDRTVTQVLIGPLEHMLRNAIDHGIESPEDRIEQGKAAQAKITVSLYRQAGNIVLDVADDGAGINVAKVRQKAIDAGLLDAQANVTEKELLQFLLSAGFSTSDSLSSISGRGVGLDVVAREVSQIGGEIEILSRQGRGTTFRIHLPMTSTLQRSLQFMLKGQQYVILLNSIEAIMQEPVNSLKQRYAGKLDRTIRYADKEYELQYMGSLLDRNIEPELDPLQESAPLLLVAGDEKNIALQVDSIVKSNDLIVKSLGAQFSVIPGLGGGVVLGDGQIVLVLDPVSIVNTFVSKQRSLFEDFFLQDDKGPAQKAYKTVLVVDDSLTVRKVTSMILERHGMHVLLAKNGLEAVEILKSTRPDVVLLDIEMPKMDGFEVASFIRTHKGNLKDLPIIMITSRVGEKHRNRAREIGVNEYMCKPFQEQNLLKAIAVYH